jgi:hypothetical protein
MRAGLGTGASAAKALTTYRYHGAFSRPYTYTGISPMALDVDEDDANHGKAEIYGKGANPPGIEQSVQGCIQAAYQVKNYNLPHIQTVSFMDQNNREVSPQVVTNSATPTAYVTINLKGVTTLKQWYGLPDNNYVNLGMSLVVLCSN